MDAPGLATILRDATLRVAPPAITAKPLRRDEDGVKRAKLYSFSIFVMVFLPPVSLAEYVTLSPA
jgi:hypothetical protein